MNPFLSARLVLPVHERLLGRSTLRCLDELEASQWWSPDDLRRFQGVKLAALLRHAMRSTPFYQQRFAASGFGDHLAELERCAMHARNMLSGLPLLTKTEIRSAASEMTWSQAPGGLIPFNTGGSTGDPLQFYIDRRRQAYDQAARMRCHRWFGVEVGSRELYLWGSPIECRRVDRLRRVRDRLFNHRLLSAFDMSVERLDHYLDEWDRFQPVSLFGYPSSIALFAEHAVRRGRRLDLRHLRAVFVTGEVCLPADRRRIEDYFGVPVADGYGSREAGFIAHQCAAGGYHITAENVIVEIVRDGRTVPDGDTGEIVVTHLDAYAMPMIRYRTGDIGRLTRGRCRCGRGLPLMDVVQGRTTDHLRLPDGTVRHALSIVYPLREMRQIRRFRVTQERDFSVHIDVVTDADCATLTRDRVSRAVRPVLGCDVRLDIRFVDHIPVLDSGKHRYVVSQVPRPEIKGLCEETDRA